MIPLIPSKAHRMCVLPLMKRIRASLIPGLVGAAITFPALATEPWRIVIPTAAQGSTDILSRELGRQLTRVLGSPVEAENLPGKSGTIAARKVVSSAPDSHRLLMATVSSHAIAMGLPEPAGYRPADFTPIAMIGTAPYLLVVANASPYTSVQSLIAAARTRGLEYSSTGTGGPHHLVGELFAQKANLTLMHRPYKGGAAALGAVMEGKVQMMLPAAILALPKMRDGSVRVLATTGARRSPRIPEVPTMAEAGLPGFEADSWYVLEGPPGMAQGEVRRVSDAVAAVLRDPSFVKVLEDNGVDAGGMPRESIAAFLEGEARKWGGLVTTLKIVPE